MENEDLASLMNFLFFAWRRTKSELLIEEDEHEFFKAEEMTKSMMESLRRMPRPQAYMPPGLVLSGRRWGGSIMMLEGRKAHPAGLAFDSTNLVIAIFITS